MFHWQLAILVCLLDGCIFTGVNRIIESFRSEKTLRSLSPTVKLTLPSPPLNHVLFLISPLRTKVTPSLSLESFWTSLRTIFWYRAKHPVETLVVIEGTERDFEVWR